ncbi:MAG: hypothetical protein A2Y79_12490 [Deltaproteobacteria bacterium RBG_13_43_22]|nr:MAG: hypothetical protein A2Y79_12490 [Deltaproteobacteria bacterium RBG_13_43_22]
MKNHHKGIDRRDFLKLAALGTVSSTVLTSCDRLLNYMIEKLIGVDPEPSPGSVPMESIKSPLRSVAAVVTDTRAVHGEGNINGDVVRGMLDAGMKTFVGKSNIEECWLTVFPDLKSSDVIGIKINASDKAFFTHKELVDAIVNSLVRIGVAENNIIVWDRSDKMWREGLISCGFGINRSKKGVRYLSTNLEGIGYDTKAVVPMPSVHIEFPLTSIISQRCDYLINVPILKAGSGHCGLTGCMKNYYGAIPLFDQSFTKGTKGIKEVHVNNCNPQIPELYSHPLIRGKTKLCIYDALLAKFEGGPFGPPQFIHNQLIMGTDPVAVDYLGLMVVERERSKRGLSSLFPYTKYIQSAAEMGLGTNNPDQIDLREVSLGLAQK